MATRRVVDPKFTRPGKGRDAKPMVLYAGLLDTAHDAGLVSLTTEILHLDLERRVAVCRATVTLLEEGMTRVFQGIGDATPQNAGQIAAEHWIRMAETRAKSRALKDAINVGDAAIEGDTDEWDDAPAFVPPTRPAPRPPAPPPPAAPPQPPRTGLPSGTAPLPAPTPGLLASPDDVETYDDDQLVEACTQMAERLAGARIAAGPMPDPRTRRSMREWYRAGYGSLATATPRSGGG